MGRAEPSGARLTAKDAALVKGMIRRGDRLHDIAAWFGVNPARVSEVKDGGRHASVIGAPNEELPPKEPYPYSSGRAAHKAMTALEETALALDMAKKALDDALAEVRKPKS
jgi:hypothetical protein